MKNIRLILLVCLIGLWNKTFSQNSPFSVNNQTGQSVTKLTSGVSWGAMLSFQRYNSGVNYYTFETGAGNFDDFRLHVNGGWATPVIAFKPDGSVGIGTASTSNNKLDVAGTVGTTSLIINHASGNSQIYFKNQGALDWDLGTQVGELTQNFNLYNRGTSSIALSINKASNNIGIGTASTSNNKLDVAGMVGTTSLMINHASGNSQIYFKNQGAMDWDLGTQVGDLTQNFNLYNRGTSSIALSINKVSNNIGIGAASTSNKLDVAGTVGTTSLMINHASGNSQIYFKNQGAMDWDLGTQVGELTQNFNLYNRGTSTIVFSINKGSNNIGIGTTNPGNFRLAVEGKIGAREVNVTTNAWNDYVFNEDYKLKSLEEVSQYIKENKHLPEIPSAKEVKENGQNLGEMNALLLKKIEELTLYAIEQNKKDQNQQQQIEKLLIEVEKLKSGK